MNNKFLFNESYQCIEDFNYVIKYTPVDAGSESVGIKFINGRFESANFPFRGQYSRVDWQILAAIEAKITEIEQRIASARDITNAVRETQCVATMMEKEGII